MEREDGLFEIYLEVFAIIVMTSFPLQNERQKGTLKNESHINLIKRSLKNGNSAYPILWRIVHGEKSWITCLLLWSSVLLLLCSLLVGRWGVGVEGGRSCLRQPSRKAQPHDCRPGRSAGGLYHLPCSPLCSSIIYPF